MKKPNFKLLKPQKFLNTYLYSLNVKNIKFYIKPNLSDFQNLTNEKRHMKDV